VLARSRFQENEYASLESYFFSDADAVRNFCPNDASSRLNRQLLFRVTGCHRFNKPGHENVLSQPCSGWKPSCSLEKQASRVDATPTSRSSLNRKAAGRRCYLALPSFSTEPSHLMASKVDCDKANVTLNAVRGFRRVPLHKNVLPNEHNDDVSIC